MAELTRTVLFESDLVTLSNVACRHAARGIGAEEINERHSVAIPVRGMFVKHRHREAVVADSTRAIFFNANAPYRIGHPMSGGDDTFTLAFSDAALLDAIGCRDERVKDRPCAPFPIVVGPLGPSALLRQHFLRRAIAHCTTLEVEEASLALLHDVLRSSFAEAAALRPPRRTGARDDWRDRIEATIVLLRRSVDRNVSLSALAAAVHSSPFHLARMFARHTGTSIHQYLLRLRLALSLELLSDATTDLTDGALALGFSSHSHFTAAFGRFFGMTPSTLREEMSLRASIKKGPSRLPRGAPVESSDRRITGGRATSRR
jgi:AraC-like DNA-binding protein